MLQKKNVKSFLISNNELKRPVFVWQYTSINKVEIVLVLHERTSMPTMVYSERETRNRQQIIFRMVWTRCVQDIFQFLMIQKKLTLAFFALNFLFMDRCWLKIVLRLLFTYLFKHHEKFRLREPVLKQFPYVHTF